MCDLGNERSAHVYWFHELPLKIGDRVQVALIESDKHWRAMCGYTHTGGIHVQRWNTPQGIEPNYSPQEVREVLYFAGVIGALSVLGFAQLANDDALAASILERIKSLAK